MASKVTRMVLVVVTALTLAVGALGITGGLGSSATTPGASALGPGQGDYDADD